MRSFLFSAALFLACCVSSCSSISVKSDYDGSVDFSKLKTWTWYSEPAAPEGIVTLTESRIRTAVQDDLTARGYPRVQSDGSFSVALHAVIQQRVEAGAEPYGYGWRTGYAGAGVMVYDEGTLLVDFVDPKTKNMIWRGTASAVVDPDASPEERDEKIRDAVKKVLDQFPPEKK